MQNKLQSKFSKQSKCRSSVMPGNHVTGNHVTGNHVTGNHVTPLGECLEHISVATKHFLLETDGVIETESDTLDIFLLPEKTPIAAKTTRKF